MPQNLVAFLFLLMRDSVVCGEIARLVNEVQKVEDKEKEFTNQHLLHYAEEIATKLIAK